MSSETDEPRSRTTQGELEDEDVRDESWMIWIASTKSSGPRVMHVRENCSYLERADFKTKKDRDLLFDETTWCQNCAGSLR